LERVDVSEIRTEEWTCRLIPLYNTKNLVSFGGGGGGGGGWGGGRGGIIA